MQKNFKRCVFILDIFMLYLISYIPKTDRFYAQGSNDLGHIFLLIDFMPKDQMIWGIYFCLFVSLFVCLVVFCLFVCMQWFIVWA